MDDSSSDDDSHQSTIAGGQSSALLQSQTVVGSFRQTASTDLSSVHNFEEMKGRDVSSTVVEAVPGSLRQLIDSPSNELNRDSATGNIVSAQIDKMYDNDRTYTQQMHIQDIEALLKENEQQRWRIKDLENEIGDLKSQIDFKIKSHTNYQSIVEQKSKLQYIFDNSFIVEELENEKSELLKQLKSKAEHENNTQLQDHYNQELEIQELKKIIKELEEQCNKQLNKVRHMNDGTSIVNF